MVESKRMGEQRHRVNSQMKLVKSLGFGVYFGWFLGQFSLLVWFFVRV